MRIAEPRRFPAQRVLIVVGLLALSALVILGLLMPAGSEQLSSTAGSQNAFATVLTLALPTFLAGVFSFLSPCTLPILPAYFAFTFQAKRQQIALMTLAFFLGLATTMTLLGATLSLVGRLVYDWRDQLAVIGGILIIGLGCMSILGKGFSGMQLAQRPATTFAGTYVFGMTFALGWSACTGPILGTLLTLLVAQGASVLAGGALALIYTLGLAVPLFLVAIFFRQLGAGSRAWTILRGKGYTVNVFGRTLYLHSTSILSGVLLIMIGALLASGRLYTLSQWTQSTAAGQWALDIETAISNFFGVGR